MHHNLRKVKQLADFLAHILVSNDKWEFAAQLDMWNSKTPAEKMWKHDVRTAHIVPCEKGHHVQVSPEIETFLEVIETDDIEHRHLCLFAVLVLVMFCRWVCSSEFGHAMIRKQEESKRQSKHKQIQILTRQHRHPKCTKTYRKSNKADFLDHFPGRHDKCY